VARACALARPLLERLGLGLIEDGDELSLATSGPSTAVVERFLEVLRPEPLSAAALQVLAIVAYEQPVTRADIGRIRSAESDGVVAALLARGLLAEERRFAMRGAPMPLVTTAAFLHYVGVGLLEDLPPLVSVGRNQA
jgi:segregation and condensation protein B